MLDFMFEISAPWEHGVSLEESRERTGSWDNWPGLDTSSGPTTNLVPGPHVVSPLPPQKKEDSKGVLDDYAFCYDKCLQNHKMGNLIRKARR